MDESPESAPLARGSLAGSEDELVTPAAPRGVSSSSNSRALKVAGLTTLACLLVASQVFTAYMVVSQKQQIHTLQKNGEQMTREMTRTSRVAPVKMHMPMSSLSLLMDIAEDKDTKPTKAPMTNQQSPLEDTALEKQLKDFLQDSQMPHFINETFLGNLEGLPEHLGELEWKSFKTWMRYWLIFQMAQQKPPAPTTSQPVTHIQTKCQSEAASGSHKIGSFRPQCDEQGHYKPMQCWHATGFCWCVNKDGEPIPDTDVRGRPQCPPVTHRMVMANRLMASAIDDK
ncbi:hypothetical protein LDENG_00011980 [Lucifuga dentata]|nr:hypothetical protein LDENG_00011980 [Lucifuga dentata]